MTACQQRRSRRNRQLQTYLGVHLERQHDLRCTVPSRGNVFRHQPDLLARRRRCLHAPRQPKITDLKITVGIQEEIRGFEIPVDDIGAMDRFECS